jgi:hypothetical protein
MLLKKVIFPVVWALIVLVCARAYAKIEAAAPPDKDILSIVPGAASFKHIKKPIDCFRLFDKDKNTVGVAVITSKVQPEVTGYANEIALLVGVNEEGVVTGVRLLAHQDGPEQMNLILSKRFLEKFTGRKPTEKWTDIEAVTGATISSSAIIEDVQSAALAAAEQVIKSGILSKKKESVLGFYNLSDPLLRAAAVIFLIALSIAAVYIPRKRHLRIACLFLSFGIIGLFLNTPITIGNFIDLGYGIIPAFNNPALLILLIYAVTFALLKGNLYCTYLCPFGAIQDGANAVKTPKLHIDGKWMNRTALIRWVILIATITAVSVFGFNGFRRIEPFSSCFGPLEKNAVWIQAGAIILAAIFLKRPWCRLFCPTGFVLELICRLGAKIRVKFGPRTPAGGYCDSKQA